MNLPDFEAWAIFARVVELRSFSAAAESLGVSKATVSKAIARLEQRLGTTLFHRTSRKLTLTESAKPLSERAASILAEAEAAEEAARDQASAPTGLIRVAAPMTFGVHHVASAIAEFLALHPGVEIDLTLSDAKIDIVAEGIDIAVRIADLPDSSLRARRVAPVAVHIVGAPALFDRLGRPKHPADLGRFPCIAYTNVAQLWHFRGPDGEEAAVRPQGPLRANNGEAMLPTLRAGLGIARLPDFIIGKDLADGRLEAVLTEWHSASVALHLLTPPSALRPARVEALLAHLAERLRASCSAA
jgi:DNA-binding transcriptional LysR family regulator